MNNSRFAKKMYEIAKEVAKTRKVNPIILACQGILESGYGGSLLARKANNLFGIKAGRSWRGPTYPINTREFYAEKVNDIDENGNVHNGWETVQAHFRLYKNWQECFQDYADIIERLSWYQDAEENYKDPLKFLNGILPRHLKNGRREPGWATDPHYRDKILSIAEKYYKEEL